MPIIIDITEAGGLVPHWRPYRKDEDVQRVYEETLSAGCSQLAQSDLGPRHDNRCSTSSRIFSGERFNTYGIWR